MRSKDTNYFHQTPYHSIEGIHKTIHRTKKTTSNSWSTNKNIEHISFCVSFQNYWCIWALRDSILDRNPCYTFVHAFYRHKNRPPIINNPQKVPHLRLAMFNSEQWTISEKWDVQLPYSVIQSQTCFFPRKSNSSHEIIYSEVDAC